MVTYDNDTTEYDEPAEDIERETDDSADMFAVDPFAVGEGREPKAQQDAETVVLVFTEAVIEKVIAKLQQKGMV